MKLTFYLFSDAVKEFDQAIIPEKLGGDEPFKEVEFKDELPFVARLYLQRNRPTTPKWLSFFLPHCDIDEESVLNQNNSALLLVKAKNRIFGVTAGFGFTAINRNKLEMGFGLRVTLNEVDPAKLKLVDSRKIDTTTRQKRVLFNHDSPLSDFEFDLDEDMLNLISGHPSDSTLGRKLSGSDSLSLTGDYVFTGIGKKCDDLLTSFEKQAYKADFGFIDHLRVVKGKDLIAELDNLLYDAVEKRSRDKIMLAYPEIDNWNQIEKFKFCYQRKPHAVEEVNLSNFYAFLDMVGGVEKGDLDAISIVGLDHDEKAVTKRHTAYDYSVIEVDHKGKRYVLSMRQWFELAKDFVEEVENYVNGIEEITTSNYLPPMKPGQMEGDYNQAVAAARPSDLALLDCKNFTLKGRSRVEVCDLLSCRGEFISVKKYNGSQTLSHLFSQNYVSSALLHDHAEYRDFIIKQCPNGWKLPIQKIGRPEADKITFVYAIATDSSKKLSSSLPFFSKVNLRQAKKNIERLGYNVRLYKIPIVIPKELITVALQDVATPIEAVISDPALMSPARRP